MKNQSPAQTLYAADIAPLLKCSVRTAQRRITEVKAARGITSFRNFLTLSEFCEAFDLSETWVKAAICAILDK
jgi:hypothetical protein